MISNYKTILIFPHSDIPLSKLLCRVDEFSRKLCFLEITKGHLRFISDRFLLYLL